MNERRASRLGLAGDLRQGLAWMLCSRRTALLAVVTLALGIGPGTAVFSVVNAVLLRGLPFEEPERLLCLWARSPEAARERLALADVRDLAERCASFAGIGAFWATNAVVGSGSDAQELPVAGVTADLLPTLGVTPHLGRTFSPADAAEGAEPVVILSHSLWQRRFAGDPAALGSTIVVRGVERSVVGVLRERFGLLPTVSGGVERFAAWIPFERWAPAARVRSFKVFHAVARLRSGVALQAAQSELDAVAGQLEVEHPDSNQGRRFTIMPIERQILGNLEGGLMLLLGAVAFVVVIAVANVSSLLLGVVAGRRQEVATRMALGASRGRIARSLLLESVLLGVAGGAVGFALGVWMLRVLIRLAPAGIPRLDEVGVDLRVLTFSVALALLAGVTSGLLPAASHLRSPVWAALGALSRRVSEGRRSRRTGELVVVGQIALAVVLLVGTGLMIRSFTRLLGVDPGFAAEELLAVKVSVPRSIPADGQLTRRLQQALAGLPGVQAAATVGFLPFDLPGVELRYVPEQADGSSGSTGGYALARPVSPGYFATMGIPLLAGRDLALDDMGRGEPIPAVVSASLAGTSWPGEDAIGRRFAVQVASASRVLEVVGVVGDVREASLRTSPQASYYVAGTRRGTFSLFVVVRSSDPPASLARPVRTAIASVSPAISVLETRTMRDAVLASAAVPRFVLSLLGLLACLAVALALVGVYGLMSLVAVRQSNEIAVRLAVGASPSKVARLILSRGLGLAVAGATLGVLGALAVGRLLAAVLYATSARDPAALLGASVLMVTAVVVASVPPVLRAARTDPVAQLRHE